MDDQERRRRMVENQLRPSNVTDARLLAAMGEIPREPFLPAHLRGVAYSDDDIRLPDGGFLVEPLAIARLLQLAAPRAGDTALVVGCDTGYTAAVLARLVGTVFLGTVGQPPVELEARLTALDAANVLLAPLQQPLAGHPERGHYDVIVLVGRVPEIPKALVDQLGEGGRLVAVVGESRVGRGTLVTRIHGRDGYRIAFDAAIPPMRGVPRPAAFEL